MQLATLRPLSPARDPNLRPPAPETNALPLDQLADIIIDMIVICVSSSFHIWYAVFRVTCIARNEWRFQNLPCQISLRNRQYLSIHESL